jgi:hypothetical protein
MRVDAPFICLDPSDEPNVAEAVTDALRRARHDLRKIGSSKEIFSLLGELAMREVRILPRSLQRRLSDKIPIKSMVRIALITAASREDAESRSRSSATG